MSVYIKQLSVRWSDLDPNFHMRHSAFYDFGAQQRIEILTEYGISPHIMKAGDFGPVLFREECVFRKEIRFGDIVFMSTEISKMRADASRWTFRHVLLGADQLTVLATITAEGAWIDTKLRKLSSPVPEVVVAAMKAFPKSADFEFSA